jgi:hypothetical protein
VLQGLGFAFQELLKHLLLTGGRVLVVC